jgi:hypothetical protein
VPPKAKAFDIAACNSGMEMCLDRAPRHRHLQAAAGNDIGVIHQRFTYLLQVVAESVMPAVMDRVEARLRVQLDLLTGIAR